MTALFLAAFIVGLVVAVRVMLYGIERTTVPPGQVFHVGDARPARPKLRLSIPVLGAFALVFGVVGYLLLRNGAAGPRAVAIAFAVGLVAAIAAAWGSVAWARVVPEHDVDDPRYVLQGHLAHVTRRIEDGVDGEIAFEVGTERRVVRARALESGSMDVGTEVVIERIENDVAWVEPWVEVERRL